MTKGGRRIIVMAEYYASGGTRTYLFQLLSFYRSRDIEVLLVGSSATADEEIRLLLDAYGWTYLSRAEVLSSESDAQHDPAVWSPAALRRERDAVRQLIRDTDSAGLVVSAGTPGAMLSACGADWPSIYILHTYPHGRRQEFLGRLLMRRYSRNVTRFVAVSEFQRARMVRMWALDARGGAIDVIPNTTGPSLAARPTTSDSRPIVITASWLEPYKNPAMWLEVARQLGRIMASEAPDFVWLGEGSMLESLRDEARHGQHECRVAFPGHVEDIDPWYQRARVYLQLSAVENMSLSTIDSLRYGIPAIVTRVGGLPEIVVDGVTGYVVDPQDAKAAASRLAEVLADDVQWTRMSEAALSRYESVFSSGQWSVRMDRSHARVFPELWV